MHVDPQNSRAASTDAAWMLSRLLAVPYCVGALVLLVGSLSGAGSCFEEHHPTGDVVGLEGLGGVGGLIVVSVASACAYAIMLAGLRMSERPLRGNTVALVVAVALLGATVCSGSVSDVIGSGFVVATTVGPYLVVELSVVTLAVITFRWIGQTSNLPTRRGDGALKVLGTALSALSIGLGAALAFRCVHHNAYVSSQNSVSPSPSATTAPSVGHHRLR